MAGLRLMTFNVQMLPLLAMSATGQSAEADARANLVADTLLGLPADEQPDVIAFNEVFSEDSRKVLVDRLAPTWFEYMEKSPDSSLDIEDSGLMLFSKLPLLQMPCGGTRLEHEYSNAAFPDVAAAKSVVVVQVQRPNDMTTIAFSHMQASYSSDEQHSDVRHEQRIEILGAIATALDEKHTNRWNDVVVIGDLNIRGDNLDFSDTAKSEWERVFRAPAGSPDPFGAVFMDPWQDRMRPSGGSPGGVIEADPGYTNIDHETGVKRRLDYQLFLHPGPGRIVPHHMWVRLHDQSDHFALESYIAPWTPNCTPTEAIRWSALPYFDPSGPTPLTTLKVAKVNFPSRDAYQWIYVNQAGTFTLHRQAHLSLKLYLTDDLAHPITEADTLDIDKLPPVVSQHLSESLLIRKGQTFMARKPFFIAVRASRAGAGTVSIFRHNGDSPDRAIWLSPHLETRAPFPVGQKLGTDDTCWFKATMVKTFAGRDRDEVFRLRNPYGNYTEFTLKDEALGTLDSVSGKDPAPALVHHTAGSETMAFSLQRGDIHDEGFAVFWDSPVSYLALDVEAGLQVNQETTSALGADDLHLDITADRDNLFTGFWGDADKGERWLTLPQQMQARLAQRMPGVRRLPFVDSIFVALKEEDTVSSPPSASYTINTLAPGDPDVYPHRPRLIIKDFGQDGIYTFFCTVTRFPE